MQVTGLKEQVAANEQRRLLAQEREQAATTKLNELQMAHEGLMALVHGGAGREQIVQAATKTESKLSEVLEANIAVRASLRSNPATFSTTLVDLTFLILNLNHLVDYGLYKDVGLDEVKQHIGMGDVLQWLGEKFKGHIDLGMYRGRPSAQEITKGLQELMAGYSGRERRKWGVQHNGICLLIAWVNELVQQREWRDLNGAP